MSTTRLRTLLGALAVGGMLAYVALLFAPVSEALPGQCAGGGAFGSGGSFCDFDAWPDGSFMHRETVCVMGFCGTNQFRACHVPGGRIPTDTDPATPC